MVSFFRMLESERHVVFCPINFVADTYIGCPHAYWYCYAPSFVVLGRFENSFQGFRNFRRRFKSERDFEKIEAAVRDNDVKDMQPLGVSIERKTIYVNEDVMMDVVEELVKARLDWKEVMRKNLRHEKAHEKFFKWNRKWSVRAEDYGWLASYLTDIVIDKIYFEKDSNYKKWLLADSRHAFESISKEIWDLFSPVASRARFLYNQAAYWVSIGAITLDEAADLYPEKADYIIELSQLFNKIKSEEDLEWAFPKAKEIYFRHFRM